LARNKCLKTLCIGENQIGTDGVVAILESESIDSLEISDIHIDDGEKFLKALEKNRVLKKVDIWEIHHPSVWSKIVQKIMDRNNGCGELEPDWHLEIPSPPTYPPELYIPMGPIEYTSD
jgi:hypothetical protein